MLLKRLGFDPAASSAPFVAITIVVIATDNCTIVSKKIVSVTSDEPGSAEWEITGNLTLLLRAERNGSGSGHTYTVTVEVTDSSGNASRQRVDVAVPGRSRPLIARWESRSKAQRGRPTPRSGPRRANATRISVSSIP